MAIELGYWAWPETWVSFSHATLIGVGVALVNFWVVPPEAGAVQAWVVLDTVMVKVPDVPAVPPSVPGLAVNVTG